MATSRESNINTRQFLDKMQEDFLEKFDGERRESCQEYLDYLGSYFKAEAEDKHFLTQCFGLQRIWSHPSLDGIARMIALKKIGRQARMLHPVYADLVFLKNREYFCKGFYKRKTKNKGNGRIWCS